MTSCSRREAIGTRCCMTVSGCRSPHEFDGRYTPSDWKLVAAHDWALANPGRPFVWVDDDLDEWRERADFGATETLLVTPQRQAGLTPRHVAEIGAWVHRVSHDY